MSGSDRSQKIIATSPGGMKSRVELAISPGVVRRAAMYALVVGTVLISINHGDAILRGDFDGLRLLKSLLTVCVPYAVSTLSSVQALRQTMSVRNAATH